MAPFFVTEKFLNYLLSEKRFSLNTVVAYENDLKQFFEFTKIDTHTSLSEVNHQLIRSWIVDLVDSEFSNKTVNRKLSSLRSFVKWCQKK